MVAHAHVTFHRDAVLRQAKLAARGTLRSVQRHAWDIWEQHVPVRTGLLAASFHPRVLVRRHEVVLLLSAGRPGDTLDRSPLTDYADNKETRDMLANRVTVRPGGSNRYAYTTTIGAELARRRRRGSPRGLPGLAGAYYAIFVELGTRRVPAHHMLTRTGDTLAGLVPLIWPEMAGKRGLR